MLRQIRVDKSLGEPEIEDIFFIVFLSRSCFWRLLTARGKRSRGSGFLVHNPLLLFIRTSWHIFQVLGTPDLYVFRGYVEDKFILSTIPSNEKSPPSLYFLHFTNHNPKLDIFARVCEKIKFVRLCTRVRTHIGKILSTDGRARKFREKERERYENFCPV